MDLMLGHHREGAAKESLTELQGRILDYIRENWPVSKERICRDLGLDDDAFRTNFSVLRHVELARATQVNGKKPFLPFEEEGQ